MARRDDEEHRPNSDVFEALLDAIRVISHEKRFEQLTVDDISRQAGVSRATFYFYFRDKKHAFTAMVLNRIFPDDRHAALSWMASVPPGTELSDYDKVVFTTAAYLRLWRDEPLVLAQFFALSLSDPEVRELYLSRLSTYHAWLEQRLAARLPELSGDDVNVSMLANSLSAMVELLCFRLYSNGTPDEASVRDALVCLSEVWYRAAHREAPPAEYDYGKAYAAALGEPEPRG